MRAPRRLLPAALLVLLPLSPLPAADAPAKHPLTVDDLWAVKRVGRPSLSADGKLMAYSVSAWEAGKDRSATDVWLQPVGGGEARRLTAHEAGDSSPALSPDGTRVVFVSKRDGDDEAQLYVIRTDGGEAERLTELPLGVSSPRWLPDGKRVAFVSPLLVGTGSAEGTRKELEKRKKEAKTRAKATVSEDRLVRYWDRWIEADQFPHLFAVDLETRKATDLTPDSRRHGNLQDATLDYDVSPDGKWIAFAANSTPPPYRTLNSDLFLVPTSGGEARNLTADNPAEDSHPVFSPDGRSLAYGREVKADGWPDRARLSLLDLATGKTRVLTEAWDAVPEDWRFTADGRTLVFRGEVRSRTNLYALPVSGGTPREVWRGGTATSLEPTPSGELVFAATSFRRPAEIGVVKLDGAAFRWLTSWNEALAASIDFGEEREVVFEGAGGEEVQMWVVNPPGFDPKKKYPLVHLVHGGPVGTFGDQFHLRWNAHAFAAPGYVVAMVNFHGSSSFGQAFVESILGANGDKPFTDVMKATDHLVAEGNVDEKRMAAAGGSYGGYLVNWIAGGTDRFAALVSHAGVYSLLSQFGSDVAYGRQHSYGGYPFTDLANVERWSPNRRAAAFRTPMLVLHGERDFRVPVTQGLELYGVLQAKGVPSRLVVYPEENHWVLKGRNAKHWYGEVLGWLARYLKG